MRPPRDTNEPGREPDARFSFANERTFLAWNRTALALVVAGLAIVQLLPRFSIPGGRHVIGVPFIALGAFIAFTSYRRWELNERALRQGRPLPASHLPRVLSIGVAFGAVLAAVLALTSRNHG